MREPKKMCLATNAGCGGVSEILLWGTPEEMRGVDSCLRTRRPLPGSGLEVNHIAHGWLGAEGEPVDEVLLAAPEPGQRILTGHGGSAAALALLKFLAGLGFMQSIEACALGAGGKPLELLLPACHTEAQAALVLHELNSPGAVGAERLRLALKTRRICLAGAPNAGKSSLLNLLCREARVLVSDIPGTTLDTVEQHLDIGGYYCAVVDTAGFRTAARQTEREAINRAQRELAGADLALLLLDASRKTGPDDYLAIDLCRETPVIIILNKSDLPETIDREELHKFFPQAPIISTCCLDGHGRAEVVDACAQLLGGWL